MRGRTREQLYIDVVEAVAAATTDPAQGGVFTQSALADLVRCSTATLTAEMPGIVAKSKELYPGYCLEVGIVERRGQVPVFRYRVVDEQSRAEIRETQRRTRKAETAIRRAIDEIDVEHAGPLAVVASELMEVGVDLVVKGLRKLEEAMV
jgi:hypothetical protein